MSLPSRLRPSLALVLAALAAGACSRGDARPAADSSGGGPVLRVAPAPAPKPWLDSGSVGFAARHHRLTMTEMRQWSAVLKRLQARAAKDPSFKLRLGYSPDSSVASQARAVSETAGLREALEGSGLSSREWVVVTMAYIGAATTARSADTTRPVAPDVNPANVAFLRKNKDAISRLQKR